MLVTVKSGLFWILFVVLWNESLWKKNEKKRKRKRDVCYLLALMTISCWIGSLLFIFYHYILIQVCQRRFCLCVGLMFVIMLLDISSIKCEVVEVWEFISRKWAGFIVHCIKSKALYSAWNLSVSLLSHHPSLTLQAKSPTRFELNWLSPISGEMWEE